MLLIEPLSAAPPGQNQYIGFKLMSEGMDGYIRVRFPENVISSLGWHFLDNVQPEIDRVSDVRVPEWQMDSDTGRIYYSIATDEGINFSGSAVVVGHTVEMTFTVENHTDSPQDIEAQVCVDLSTSDSFGERKVTGGTFAVYSGDKIGFNTLTGDLKEKRTAQTGYPWVLMLTGDGPHDYLYGYQRSASWWIADQRADLPLIWRQSRDGRFLVAVAWGKETVHRLMTNTSIPCLHADPLAIKQLLPGRRAVWHGRIFVMENDTNKLLEAYRRFQSDGLMR